MYLLDFLFLPYVSFIFSVILSIFISFYSLFLFLYSVWLIVFNPIIFHPCVLSQFYLISVNFDFSLFLSSSYFTSCDHTFFS